MRHSTCPSTTPALFVLTFNPSVCSFQQIGEEEKSSVAKNPLKTQSFGMAAAAIEKLDSEVQHGDNLKGVRITFAPSLSRAGGWICFCPIDQ